MLDPAAHATASTHTTQREHRDSNAAVAMFAETHSSRPAHAPAKDDAQRPRVLPVSAASCLPPSRPSTSPSVAAKPSAKWSVRAHTPPHARQDVTFAASSRPV